MKKLALLVISIIVIVSCKKEPVAEFSCPASTKVGQVVQFTNLSSNANSYMWVFGDGFSSSEKNPSHTFAKPGDYDVKLDATGDNGTASIKKSIKITGTTYSFRNDCSGSLPGFFTFYWDGTNIVGLIDYGILAMGSLTPIVITEQTYVKFGIRTTTTFFFSVEDYTIVPGIHNIFPVTNTTQIYGGKSSVKGIESEKPFSLSNVLVQK